MSTTATATVPTATPTVPTEEVLSHSATLPTGKPAEWGEMVEQENPVVPEISPSALAADADAPAADADAPVDDDDETSDADADDADDGISNEEFAEAMTRQKYPVGHPCHDPKVGAPSFPVSLPLTEAEKKDGWEKQTNRRRGKKEEEKPTATPEEVAAAAPPPAPMVSVHLPPDFGKVAEDADDAEDADEEKPVVDPTAPPRLRLKQMKALNMWEEKKAAKKKASVSKQREARIRAALQELDPEAAKLPTTEMYARIVQLHNEDAEDVKTEETVTFVNTMYSTFIKEGVIEKIKLPSKSFASAASKPAAGAGADKSPRAGAGAGSAPKSNGTGSTWTGPKKKPITRFTANTKAGKVSVHIRYNKEDVVIGMSVVLLNDEKKPVGEPVKYDINSEAVGTMWVYYVTFKGKQTDITPWNKRTDDMVHLNWNDRDNWHIASMARTMKFLSKKDKSIAFLPRDE